MVLSDPVGVIVTIALAIGVPALVVLFYFEGLIIGKLLQPPIVFIAYVGVLSPTNSHLLFICVLCVIAATVGQWTLYRGFVDGATEFIGIRKTVPRLDELPEWSRARVGEKRMQFVDTVFDRYGGAGIVGTNAIPGIRCLMTIPAGMSNYPRRRFLLTSFCGNVCYIVFLVAAGYGVRGAAGLF
ncbi:membrane-associated protein [Halorubraceae archaeon YAN]|nr:membrane-associated protein [Halorubraceae archaeon YAN]